MNLKNTNKSILSNFHLYNMHKQKASQVTFIKTNKPKKHK